MFLVAVIALFLLVYTYFGYPLVIAVLARLRPLKIERSSDYEPKVSVLIPVYNAASYIEDKIESLLAMDYPQDKLEILLLSDASEDGSDEKLAELQARFPDNLVVLRHEERSGKPSALNRMRREATGEVFFLTDIRQKLDPACLRQLVSYLADSKVGAVSGSLELEGGIGAGFYWKYEKWIRKNEGQFRSMVGVTGAVYAVRANDFVDLPRDVTLDDMWVPMRLRLQGQHVVFAKDAIAYDEAFADAKEFGRKARTLAGNFQLIGLLPGVLLPFVNPSWFEFMSHKVFRLLCPWAMLALLATSGGILGEAGQEDLRWWSAAVLMGGQLAFYALAAVGGRAGKLGSVARTFVVMNAAAVVGFWRFVRGAQRVTW